MSEVYKNAYSLELNKPLEPNEAYQLSIQKKLKENNGFQCSEHCDFQLILVNFGKKDYIQAPHYRSAKLEQSHSTGCTLMKEQALARIGQREDSYSFTRNDSKITVELDLIKGLLVEVSNSKTIKTVTGSPAGSTSYTSFKGDSTDNTEKKELHKKIKSLKSLIDYYERIRQGELFDIVDRQGVPLNLENHFHDLRIHPELEEGLVKIYIADAWVSLRGSENDPYYHLKLTSECELINVIAKPTLNMNKKGSVHRGVTNKEKFLERQAREGTKYKVYFFGSFILNESNKNFYINFDLSTQEALDFLVFYPY